MRCGASEVAQQKSPRLINAGFLNLNGAGNRNRTYDLIITNDALYQLSYSGIKSDILARKKSFGNTQFRLIEGDRRG